MVENKKVNIKFNTPMILICFALVCFFTSCVFNNNTGRGVKKQVTHLGGEIGPINISKDNSVYEINLAQRLGYGSWSNVEGEVLDENKKHLFTFNKELWAERGYDSEGAWTESDNKIDTKITFKKKGIYYIRLSSEASADVNSNIQIAINKKRGSGLPHLMAGIFSLILGLFLYFRENTGKIS